MGLREGNSAGIARRRSSLQNTVLAPRPIFWARSVCLSAPMSEADPKHEALGAYRARSSLRHFGDLRDWCF